MSVNKRFYWMKLKEDFFNDIKIKKLRRVAGGDTYTIIYQKILLLTLPENGILYYEGIEKSLESEIALTISEKLENVQITLAFMQANKLIEKHNENEYYLPEMKFLTGSETASTIRSHRYREKNRALQCNTYATPMQRNCNGEIEREIEIEIDKEKDNKKKVAAATSSHPKFVKPSEEEIIEYGRMYFREEFRIDEGSAFFDHFESNGWRVGGKTQMKDWKAALNNWHRRDMQYRKGGIRR